MSNILPVCLIRAILRRNWATHESSEIYTNLSMGSCINELSGSQIIYNSEIENSSGHIEFDHDLNNDDMQPGWRSNYGGDYVDRDFKPFCSHDLLLYAYQVASGMEFLSQRKVLHCDLAARNILVAENNIVKICDFGLAKALYKDENYKEQSEGKFPVKWMAIESIRDGVFSIMSDVWSYGVVLWKIFTLAEVPYSGIGFEKMFMKLIRGYRMGQPVHATKDIYEIMLSCWEEEPTLRPSFTKLVESIGQFLQNGINMHYQKLCEEYEDLNKISYLEGKKDFLNMMTSSDCEINMSNQYNSVNILPQVDSSSHRNMFNDISLYDTKKFNTL